MSVTIRYLRELVKENSCISSCDDLTDLNRRIVFEGLCVDYSYKEIFSRMVANDTKVLDEARGFNPYGDCGQELLLEIRSAIKAWVENRINVLINEIRNEYNASTERPEDVDSRIVDFNSI